ncbi:MAG: peptidoglycan-associated lipoprotein Pal [Acidobacteria bacterium]|nr:peptidoglycan-associated lipoprotein Pal [Acidobacteriota bacterium]
MRSRSKYALLCLMVLMLFAGACRKEVVAPPPATPPPAPPAPARPTVTLQASQTFIQRGDGVTLSWSSTNATELTLAPEVGRVSPEGSTRVTPADSMTYTITAAGPGGTADMSVRITVAAPPPPPPPPAPKATIEELFRTNVLDAFFDYDKFDIRPDGRDALARTAEFLRAHPQIRVVIEGHCDERGSTEYNLGLGERRAQTVRQFLISLGVSADRMDTVSLGKERPFCTQSSEDCWQQNRRGHFVMAR